MNFKYIQNNSDQLIIFFSGWGMEDIVCRKFDLSGYDLLCLYDYRSMELPEQVIRIISGYNNKHLVCWSMGIMAAELVHESLNDVRSRIALCGSPFAISDQYGIPSRVYQLTLQSFSAQVVTRFIANMGLRIDNLKELDFQDSLEDKRSELQILSSYQPASNINFDTVILAEKDHVFPYDNLLNYWQKTNTKIITLDCGHYLFDCFRSWQEIMDLANDK